jgi:hypothetical protein
LYQQGTDKLIISINRKSRIIMKDATAIIEKARKIKTVIPSASICLATNAPICSKSLKHLKENGIEFVENT